MKILIAGGGPFSEHLIARLNRERHDVYQIQSPQAQHNLRTTSSEGHVTKYYFDLDDESLGFVVSSIRPDAIIFLGVMNGDYDWSLNHRSSSAMLSGLSSLLCLAAANQIPRFIYLSSIEVYGSKHGCRLDESIEKRPDNIKGHVISEGENLCTGFNDVSGLSPTVLRLSNVYGTGCGQMDDFASKLFISMINPDAEPFTLMPPVNMQFSPVYVSDAVDAIYKAVTARDRFGGIYNISGADVYMSDIYKLAGFVAGMECPMPEPGEPITLTADGSLFSHQYGFRAIVDISTGLRRTYKAARKEKKKEEKVKRKSKGLRRILRFIAPFMENVFVFSLIVGMYIFASRMPQLAKIDFLMIYIVVISVIFGLLQSSIAVIFSFGFIIWQNTNQSFMSIDFVTGFDMLLRMVQLLIVGMLCGYSTDSMRTRLDERDLALTDVRSELDAIFEINDRNTKIKQALDSRLANYENSLAKIYSITDRMNSLQVDEVFFSAINAVSEVMNSNDVSIYIVTGYNDKICRLVAKSPNSERPLRKSVPLADFGEMAELMMRDEIYINHELSHDLPVMAAPIFSARDLVSIIMLWSVDFEDLTIHNSNNLLVLSKLISSIIEKAYIHTQYTAAANRLKETGALVPEAYKELLKIHEQARKDGVSQYCIMNVYLDGRTLEEVVEKICGMLRGTDYIGCTEEGQLQILLTNTNQNDVKFVYERMVKAGITVEVLESNE